MKGIETHEMSEHAGQFELREISSPLPEGLIAAIGASLLLRYRESVAPFGRISYKELSVNEESES